VSLVLHLALLTLLAEIWLRPAMQGTGQIELISNSEQTTRELDTAVEHEPLETRLREVAVNAVLAPALAEAGAGAVAVTPPVVPRVEPELVSTSIDWRNAAKEGLANLPGVGMGGTLSGRGTGLRQYMADKHGGSAASEEAVDRALKWLAEHQFADGSWSLQMGTCPKCQGRCRNPGTLPGTRVAATGLALLPFLGAGYTHKEGQYKTVVNNGLHYLLRQSKTGSRVGALNESGGGMYSHGIATIALCEAHAMTYDRILQFPAQQAVRFICDAQDPNSGGWRYHPLQSPGDTSVIGWQLMALKSARLCDMPVPPAVLSKAERFLDSVQMEEGSRYQYLPSGKTPVPPLPPQVQVVVVKEASAYNATTAIGLLCRMFLGWKRDNPALHNGVAYLADLGPSKGNMYYNYYATQVMWHWEGEEWRKWNDVMREMLIQTQSRQGHETGSWHFAAEGEDRDEGTRAGGRLYMTALATMILEIYYRHMPIYAKLDLQAEPSP